MTMTEFLGRLLFISVAIFLYYYLVKVMIGLLSGHIVNHLSLKSRYPYRDLNEVVKLVLGGISQAIFCYVLILVIHLGPRQLGLGEFQPILLVDGILLGIGEMALSTFLCSVAISISNVLFPGGPTDLKDWLVVAKGGWMQKYVKTIGIVPLPLALLSILPYISVEEIVFRGVLINYFLPAGAIWALGIAVFFFVVVQIFFMPGWRAAMFPVTGSIVIGIVHSLLFLAVPDIVPLIVAHFVCFMASVL